MPIQHRQGVSNWKKTYLFRRMFTLMVTICLALPLAATTLAADTRSLAKKEKESESPCTFGDLAAARLAVYGILNDRYRVPREETGQAISRPEAVTLLWNAFAKRDGATETAGKDGVILYKHSHNSNLADGGTANIFGDSGLIAFDDLAGRYADAVTWACRSGIAKSVSETRFGVFDCGEEEFVAMLLNAMGYQGRFAPELSVKYAESIGLAPLGLSRYFTLGDAALYLQNAMELYAPDGSAIRDRMNLSALNEQATFPAAMVLTPLFYADVEPQIQEATRYLAARIEVRGDYLAKDDMLRIYECYHTDSGEAWYLSRTWENDPYMTVSVDTMESDLLPPEELEEYSAVNQALWEDYSAGKLSYQEYSDRYEAERITRLCDGTAVTLFTCYNEAWELACDADDAFTLYVDDTLSGQADMFYRRTMARAQNDREAVLIAKSAINGRAEYADPVSHDENGNFYAPEAHSILGFFQNGRVVCDGYASVFQYLMLRSGVECVMVLGSTKNAEDAEHGLYNHAWNKVKLSNHWYNMDVCWSDTGWPTILDLQSDEFYAGHSHWAVTFKDL